MPMASFETYAVAGDVGAALRFSVLNGALWAIGSAWATATREVAMLLLPADDTATQAAWVEVVAACVVTGLGLAVALGVGYCTAPSRPA